MMKQNVLVIIFLIFLMGSAGLVMPVTGASLTLINNVPPFESPFGTISINATVPEYSSSLFVYHGILGENGSINLQLQQIGKERQNVTTPQEAPEVAQRVLVPYGGFPSDAVYNGASTTYTEYFDRGVLVSKEPSSTTVFYSRMINGLWVIGDSNSIILELGENGDLLWIFKIWRDYTYTGDVPIIPLNTAFEKLQRGEVIDEPMVTDEKIILDIASPGYYAKKVGNSDTILEPVWMLYGNTSSGSRLGFYVYARHFANFTASSTNISTFQSVQFTDTSEAAPTKWYWDFGDGTNSTEQNPPSHMYRTAGNFTISLTTWNDMGSDTETKTGYIRVNFNKPLNADFNATPRIASTGDAIRFYDASDSSPNKWYWEFGDGKNSTLRNPVHAYNVGGNYTVNLTAWNSNGSDKRSVENYIRIYPDPKPDASYTSNYSWDNRIPPLTVAFNDTSVGYIANWSWDFGDGTNSSERNPVHTFTLLPHTVYRYLPVNLMVTDPFGRTSSYWEYIFIYKGYQPNFSADPTLGPAPLTVIFKDLTEDPEESPEGYWDFGDGQYQNLWEKPFPTTVVHEYAVEGAYNVTLTYYGPMEDRFSTTKEFYITVRNTTAPMVSDFTANITSGKAPLSVAFTDTSTGFPISWSWDFGDSSNSTEKNPVHTYTTTGTYTVSLNATNANGGNTSTKIDYITVFLSHPPSADFTANTTEGKSPLTVAFIDNSTNSPVNWSWDFGDDTNSTELNPVHVYTKPGKYTVSLCVMNDDGSNTLTRTEYITVHMELPTMTIVPPPPVLPVSNFTAKPLSGREPLTVVFNDSSTGIPVSWAWSFGDGETSSNRDPVHRYLSAGNYTVSLTTTNPHSSNTTTRVDYIEVTSTTPTVTPTPQVCPTAPVSTGNAWILTSICTDGTRGLMRVRNGNSTDIPFTWDLYGTTITGSGIAIHNNDTFFWVPDRTKTVRLNAYGKPMQTKAQNTNPCNACYLAVT